METTKKLRAGIVGAKALTSGVLVELILQHPHLELGCLAGRDPEPVPFEPFFPELRGRLSGQPSGTEIVPFDADDFARRCDVAFLTLPHAAAAETARELHARGCMVVDLSADFRFSDLAIYEATYKHKHPAPELNDEAPYALAEIAGAKLRGARIVGVPGCYVTSVLVPLLPLMSEDILDPSYPIIADCKSGVSGAGRTPSDTTHFVSANESLAAYGIGGHRHRPEMLEKLREAAPNRRVDLVFTPHLVPMDRGILSTIYVRPSAPGTKAARVREIWRERYEGWRLVRVLKEGERPSTKAVLRTGFCDIAAFDDAETDTIIIVSALDNLMKGASSQAVQALNLMQSWPDHLGILMDPDRG